MGFTKQWLPEVNQIIENIENNPKFAYMSYSKVDMAVGSDASIKLVTEFIDFYDEDLDIEAYKAFLQKYK